MSQQENKPKILVLCGPTAVGKTGMAIAVAKALGGEIVNADSVQVYRGMDIGSAKPTPEERKSVPHHMIDILDPDEPYDANRFAERARKIIQDLHDRGVPVLVSRGTGFYIKALCQGLFQTEPGDGVLRERLRREAETQGLDSMVQRLTLVDPDTARALHPNDRYRILRALEVFESTGIPVSAHRQSHGFSNQPYEVLKIGLDRDRERLYERIDLRVEAMLEEGLEAEVRKLLERGYSRSLKSMQTIGYSHMAAYLEGELSREEMVRTLKRDTRRYAKRQLTWFRKDPDLQWVDPGDPSDALAGILNRIRAFGLFR